MKGRIELITRNEGFIAVKTESGEYSVLELLGGYAPVIGDIISGKLENLGGEDVFNVTQDEEWHVYIQDIHSSEKGARNMLNSFG